MQYRFHFHLCWLTLFFVINCSIICSYCFPSLQVFVFSLGRTLWTAAEYGVGRGSRPVSSSRGSSSTQPSSGSAIMSSNLRSTLSAMTHNLPAHRLTLVDIFQVGACYVQIMYSVMYFIVICSLYLTCFCVRNLCSSSSKSGVKKLRPRMSRDPGGSACLSVFYLPVICLSVTKLL